MKLTIGEAREFVRARLDELAAQESDMLLSAIDDRNLDNTVDTLLEEAVTYIHLAAPASLMEGPILSEANFAPGDLTVTDRVVDIDTALADIDDDILRFISFQCGDSDIKLTRAFYEDSPEARMQLNKYIQGQPDSPALVRLDDSPDYRPHFKYYTTDMCVDGIGRALRFVLRYFAKPKLEGGSLSVSPAALTFNGGLNPTAKSVTVSSTTPWRITSNIPEWLSPSETEGTGSAVISFTTLQQNRGAQRSVSLVFANDETTATLEVTQKGYSTSEGDERLRVASTVLINGTVTLPSMDLNVYYLRVAAEEGLAWTAVLSDTTNFYMAPTSGIGTGIDNYSSVTLYALSQNDTGYARTATITFSAVGVTPIVITLRQPTQLTVTPKTFGVPAAGGTYEVAIKTEGAWVAATDGNPPQGFTFYPTSGNGNGTLICTVPANTTTETRAASLYVSGEGFPVQVLFTQAAASASSIGVSPASLGPFPASGSTEGMTTEVTVTANPAAWTIDTNTLPSWATIRRNTETNKLVVTAVSPKTTTGTREQAVMVYLDSDNTKTASFTISQQGIESNITILDSVVPLDTVTVPYTGGNYSATLTATGPWSISANKSWINITSATSGQAGTSTVTFNVTSGTTADDATITGNLLDGQGNIIKTCEYYIIREGAPVVEDDIKLTRLNNNFYDNVEIDSSSQANGFDVIATGAWTVSVDPQYQSWLHVYGGGGGWSGSGNGTCWFEADINTGSSRYGTMTGYLTGKNKTATFTVYQSGNGTPTLTASFNKSEIDSTQQTIELRIRTENGIAWSIDQISSGLTIANADKTGTGSADINVGVDSYSGSSSRPLSVRVRNVSYNLTATPSVTQNPPVAPSTSLIITPNGTKNIQASDTSLSITVRASNVTWSASCTDNTVTLSPTSGTNNGTISASFSANESTSNPRTFRITVSGGGYSRELYVVQARKSSDPLVVSPTEVNLPANGGTSGSITVTTSGTWSLTKSDSWITTSINAGTLTPATSFTISASANTGGQRSGTVTVSGGGTTKTVTVTQASAASLVVSTETVTLAQPASSTGTLTVYAHEAWEVDEETSDIPVWLGYSYSTHAGSDNGEVLTFTASTANTYDSARSATVKIKLVDATSVDPVSVTVLQSGNANLTVTPLNTTADEGPDSGEIDITSNTNWSVVQISEGLSFDEDDMSGTGNKSDIPWYVTGNPLLVQRSLVASIRTADGSITRPFTVVQDAGVFSVTPNSLEFAGSGENLGVLLCSSSGWDIQSKPSWITSRSSSNMPDPDGVQVTLVAAANLSATRRSGQVVFRQNTYGHTVTVDVSQVGGLTLETLDINPTEVHLPDGDATTVQLSITSSTSWAIDLSHAFGTTASATTGTGDATVTLSVPINTANTRRIVVYVRMTNKAVSKRLDIWQHVSDDDIAFEPNIGFLEFSEDAPMARVTVTSNRNWTAASDAAWLQFSPNSGTANDSVVVTFSPRISITKVQHATWTVTTAGGATKTISCTSLPSIEPFNV